MKICIAQTKSQKGKAKENIQNHLRIIELGVKSNTDLIIFPELSITNYEPNLAKELTTEIENSIFNLFQELSNNNDVTIGIGMPTKANDGIKISMLIFQPNEKRVVYSKQMLHSDELPYFVCGNDQVILNIKEKKIAIGICFETLQSEHFLNANKEGADIYIASVAKPKGGIEKAYKHFPKIAREFSTPILMSNCIGNCHNFISVGQSAVWNKNGKLIEHLDSENQGILIYDTETELVKIDQSKIEKGQLFDLEKIFQIYLNGKIDLENNGIYQWTDNYPSISIIENDLKKDVLYTLKSNEKIIGAINISEEQETEYKLIKWEFNNSKVLVIHRLVIDPKYQKKGYAQKLMDFAENFAKENNYSSIRLDAYSQNLEVIEFYKKRNYFIRGNVNFPEREYPFHCMEKDIITVYNNLYN
ncbi:GNAT family N-acetyltransferase [Polaribacter sp. KT25b]|uniref:GNAT family N-acetyltransferase n=1 Tax=Polaribacter sp. KT25b TaxID=1855336 RepID=UPI0012FDA39E|nr:GNAT family N-acetyltransferase [Polaribacter sp. KT25b]